MKREGTESRATGFISSQGRPRITFCLEMLKSKIYSGDTSPTLLTIDHKSFFFFLGIVLNFIALRTSTFLERMHCMYFHLRSGTLIRAHSLYHKNPPSVVTRLLRFRFALNQSCPPLTLSWGFHAIFQCLALRR